ncbi:MBL fold metallo-hydrolase [uncultured Roseovarius sp.]|uniref:MBL fold metallo-hydrolase n=1 Tax=uncultured Roseovarius sp. TaxID=293344 RepID=UPI002610B46B|nr:MBL fold metallo-hydrolase [uncultured Roseovarius sp.]
MTDTSSTDRSFLHGHSEGGVWDKAGAPTGQDAWRPLDLGQGVYALEVDGGNPGGTIGMLVGDESSVLIDNGLEKSAAVTVAATEKLAGGPIDYLISTHLHADHVGCNATYAAAGTTIISHVDTRRLLSVDDTFDKAGLPVLTFSDRATIHLNGLTLELIPFANAHTLSDTIVHFVEANIIHTGDLFFNKIYPFMDLDNGGNIDGFIAAQRQIIDMANDDTVIIAGHGPIGNKAEMQTAVDLLLAIKATMKPLIEQGMSMEDVLQENPLSVFEHLAWFHITTERMTKIIYHLLTEG